MDEYDDIDESEAKRLPQKTPWVTVDVEEQSASQGARHLVLIGTRLAKYREALGASRLAGKIKGGAHIAYTSSTETGDGDLYEVEGEEEPVKETHYEVPVYYGREQGSLFIVLPALDASQCYDFTAGVLGKLEPKRITMLVAGTIAAPDNVLGLYSTQVESKPLKPLQPPFTLTGLPGSIIAYGETNGLPTTAAVVRAEGPTGFEAVDHYATHDDVCAALELLLGVPKGSIKVSLENQDRSLYI